MMSTLRTVSAGGPIRALAALLLLLTIVAFALVVVAPLLAVAFALAGLGGLLLLGFGAARPVRPTAPRAAAFAEGEPTMSLRLTLPDGQVLTARPIPLAGQSNETLLLTSKGYVVVNADGHVLHRL